MNALLPAASAASAASDVPPALTIAAALAVVIVVIAVVVVMYRSSRLNPATGSALGVTVVVAILGGALLVGGALTQPPTAVAVSVNLTPPAVSETHTNPELDGLQLPTLFLDGVDEDGDSANVPAESSPTDSATR